MNFLLRFGSISVAVGVLLSAGCGSGGKTGTSGSGGAAAGSTGGRGGGVASGSGGRATGTGGSTAGSGGSVAGTGGTAAGTGGAAAASGGRGGGTSTGGRGGSTAGTGGQGGGVGAGGAAGAGSGDSFVTGVTITVHPQTTTILVVTWTQARAADTTWLEFTFAGGSVMTSRPAAAVTGAHRDVVLGVPELTAVTVRIVNRQAAVDYKTRDYQGTTGAIPAGMPRPMVLAYNAALASPDRWMFGSVEDSSGGCTTRSCYFDGLFWVYIMDRQGRIVWYYVDASSNAATGFQRVARDGQYIWIEKSRTGTRGVVKMTLDRQYMQTIPVAGLADAIDVTTDGSLLYDASNELREMNRAGTIRTIWSCRTFFGAAFNCYSNTINWNPADDTVLMSFPEPNTVIQINRQTGAVVGQYGDAAGSYTFSPSTWSFEYQHFPNITPQGTLILSSHLPAFPDGSPAGPMQHAFMEFDIDRPNRRLVERWIYSDGTEWPLSRGMAIRLPNGNTLGNYGTGGAIREITPSKQTVFHIKFDVPTGNDFANKMVGNNVLIDDLYALNGGGPM